MTKTQILTKLLMLLLILPLCIMLTSCGENAKDYKEIENQLKEELNIDATYEQNLLYDQSVEISEAKEVLKQVIDNFDKKNNVFTIFNSSRVTYKSNFLGTESYSNLLIDNEKRVAASYFKNSSDKPYLFVQNDNSVYVDKDGIKSSTIATFKDIWDYPTIWNVHDMATKLYTQTSIDCRKCMQNYKLNYQDDKNITQTLILQFENNKLKYLYFYSTKPNYYDIKIIINAYNKEIEFEPLDK